MSNTNLETAIQLAAAIKESLTELEHAIAELPESTTKGKVTRLARVHHNRLNRAAEAAAELFQTDIAVMSGGGDKPPIEP